jgi:hypothetical protein
MGSGDLNRFRWIAVHADCASTASDSAVATG